MNPGVANFLNYNLSAQAVAKRRKTNVRMTVTEDYWKSSFSPL
jgi:hypothetical protein